MGLNQYGMDTKQAHTCPDIFSLACKTLICDFVQNYSAYQYSFLEGDIIRELDIQEITNHFKNTGNIYREHYVFSK